MAKLCTINTHTFIGQDLPRPYTEAPPPPIPGNHLLQTVVGGIVAHSNCYFFHSLSKYTVTKGFNIQTSSQYFASQHVLLLNHSESVLTV